METKNKTDSAGRKRAGAAAPAKKAQSARSAAAPRKQTSQHPTATKRGAAAQRRAVSNRNAQRKTTAQKAKRPVRRPTPSAEVVYTPPENFILTVFVLRLITVVAVVAALVFSMAIFFKVAKVEVTGNEKYTAQMVAEAADIREGENLFGINSARVSSRIRAALPYVYSARVAIKLPDTVRIEIVELDIVYAAQAENGNWWLLSSEGLIVDSTTASEAGKYTHLQGIQLQDPVVGEAAVAAEPIAESTDETLLAPPVIVTSSEKLSTALSIFQFLEKYGVIGDAASVNVEDLSQIELWYEDRYQVKLGDTSQLDYKVKCMKLAIDQMSDYQTGVLDVSFTTWPNEVGYNPFS